MSRARWLLVAAASLPLILNAEPTYGIETSILSSLDYNSLQWHEDPVNPGSWYSIVSGNPSRSGRFVILNRVLKGHFNRPHRHAHPREIYVVKGTWWVGKGKRVDLDASVAKGAGSFTVHYANEVHWDGARNEDVLLLIEGEGPAMDHFVK